MEGLNDAAILLDTNLFAIYFITNRTYTMHNKLCYYKPYDF